MAYQKACAVCGTSFEAGYFYAKYCCKKCRDFAAANKSDGKERPFTQDTPYLCRKWRAEGMSVKEIAQLLGRSPGNVRKAIQTQDKKYK